MGRHGARSTVPTASRSAGSATWEEEGLYRAGAGARRDETFVIALPPPNVTGALHMGHALNGSIQDVLVRWHRMRGFDTLWQPGYDHAGISTQNVVEKQLSARAHSRRRSAASVRRARLARPRGDGRTIMGQYRRLGASLAYERERFTMDDAYVEAVMRFFVHLWDRAGSTAPNGSSTGARSTRRRSPTSRSCTRHGRHAHVRALPLRGRVGCDHDRDRAAGDDPRRRRGRRPSRTTSATATRSARGASCRTSSGAVPVIADERVDPEFGTGALKITPGHDPIDFEIGRDHDLPTLTVIGPDGRMNERGEFAGVSRGRRTRRSSRG
jgi:valyl-tRNA synthetase